MGEKGNSLTPQCIPVAGWHVQRTMIMIFDGSFFRYNSIISAAPLSMVRSTVYENITGAECIWMMHIHAVTCPRKVINCRNFAGTETKPSCAYKGSVLFSAV